MQDGKDPYEVSPLSGKNSIIQSCFEPPTSLLPPLLSMIIQVPKKKGIFQNIDSSSFLTTDLIVQRIIQHR